MIAYGKNPTNTEKISKTKAATKDTEKSKANSKSESDSKVSNENKDLSVEKKKEKGKKSKALGHKKAENKNSPNVKIVAGILAPLAALILFLKRKK